jgi:hypothetical protein
MPLIFIHGVNTRFDDSYVADVAARDEMIQLKLLDPLAERDDRFAQMAIVNSYWGDLGASFSWNQQSFPTMRVLATLGSKDAALEDEADVVDVANMLEDIVISEDKRIGDNQKIAEPDSLQRAASRDPVRFIEAVFLPLIRSGQLHDKIDTDPKASGRSAAHVIIAADEAALKSKTRTALKSAKSDDQALEIFRRAVLRKHEELFGLKGQNEIRALGSSWQERLVDGVSEFFVRAKQAPKRAATYPVLRAKRRQVHDRFSLFLGDVFVYLTTRGTPASPGPIISRVLDDIQNAVKKKRKDEPTLILTHSMGGNIFYDIVTAFAPRLKVDFWFSVAGQVGQFEEMKLFLNSDPKVIGPKKVTSLRKRVGRWHNIYDPGDPVSFLVEPVFADTKDHEYVTGSALMAAHSDYFKLPGFYRLLRRLIEEGMSSTT